MILRWVKWGVMGAVGVSLLGGMLFGKDLISYARSSAKGVRAAVKDSVPIEFELRRARDLLEEIIPEMQANIRVIATEEVEIAALKGEIGKQKEGLEGDESLGPCSTISADEKFKGRSCGPQKPDRLDGDEGRLL